MLFFKKKQPPTPPQQPRVRQKITVDASDNLFVRAEKIVAMLGLSGETRTSEYDVYRALHTYAELDAEASKTAKPADAAKLCQCDKP